MNIFLTSSSLILGSWTESYPGNEIPPNIQRYNQIDQYISITAGNFYIYEVTFTTVNETEGNGGAINVLSDTNILIESSNFIMCHSKGNGGALNFNTANGRSFLKKVCSMNSYSSASFNNFCLISTKPSDKCTNCIEHSSVANLKSTANNNIHLCNSDIVILKYDNISKNECSHESALKCSPSISSSISYSLFENNTSIDLNVISFSMNRQIDMNTCNVIRNTVNIDYAVIYVWGILKISNSCLIENSKAMFHFFSMSSSSNSTCTIINCTIDSTDNMGTGRAIVDSNRIPSESFINNLDNNRCFSINTGYVCPTFNMRQYKYQLDRYRGIFIVANIR